MKWTELFVDFLSKAYAKYIERLRFRITEKSPQEKWNSADGCGFKNTDKDLILSRSPWTSKLLRSA